MEICFWYLFFLRSVNNSVVWIEPLCPYAMWFWLCLKRTMHFQPLLVALIVPHLLGFGESLDDRNALKLGCQFMKSNGLKFVTITSVNQPLLRSHEFSACKFAQAENLPFRVRSFGYDAQSMYHQDSYLIIASAEGNCFKKTKITSQF